MAPRAGPWGWQRRDPTMRPPDVGPGAITLHTELRPGDLASVVHLHGVTSARERGFDPTFARVVRQHVGPDHVLHAPDVLRIRVRRDAPGLDDPRLDAVFFSACRTVSVLTLLTSPSTTSSSASSCRVQWQR